MFRTVPLSIIVSFSLYTQQWCMSYRLQLQLAISRIRTELILFPSGTSILLTDSSHPIADVLRGRAAGSDRRWFQTKITTLYKLTYKSVYAYTRRLHPSSFGALWSVYTGCPRRNVPHFGRVFLMLKYTDITQNTYVQSWTVTEIMAREVWIFDSCYKFIDYQIHIKTGRNMWFL